MEESQKKMDLTIIIVNYNTKSLIDSCLESIECFLGVQISYEVIVVDNASTDGSQNLIWERSQKNQRIKGIFLPNNIGFAGGNNAAITIAKGRNILLLNSDAYLIDKSLIEAVNFLDNEQNTFSLGCLLLTAEGKSGPSYGYFPNFIILIKELVTNRYSQLRAVCPKFNEGTHEIDFPCGAFFLFKAALISKVGLLDQNFFMYFEETDYAKRAKNLGYRNVYFSNARAVHLGGKSTLDVKPNYLVEMFYKNWNRYLKKHHSATEQLLVRILLHFYFQFIIVINSTRRKINSVNYFKSQLSALRNGWKI